MTEHDDVQALWAEQTAIPMEVDMKRIQEEAVKFERGIRRRNVLELGAGAIVAVAFGAYAVLFDHPVARLGAVGVLVGVGIVVAVTLRYGREPALPGPDQPTAAFLEAYRAALLRQARLLRWVPLWYVAPLLVPAAVFAVGMHAYEGREGLPTADLGVFALLGVAVTALNAWGAHRIRRRAEALG